VDPGVFPCAEDTQCGPNGNCEATGYCSFPDPACGGQRYGELAPAGLSGQCVIAPGGADAGGRTPDAAPPPDGLPVVADAPGTDGESLDIVCNPASPCPFVVCPAGATCRITCESAAACPLVIDCSEAAACDIECQGTSSCTGAILCGFGPCDISCQGAASCAGPIDCSDSCACRTSCSTDGCADVMCPTGCVDQGECTALGSSCDRC
jgi:hypothetical protein